MIHGVLDTMGIICLRIDVLLLRTDREKWEDIAKLLFMDVQWDHVLGDGYLDRNTNVFQCASNNRNGKSPEALVRKLRRVQARDHRILQGVELELWQECGGRGSRRKHSWGCAVTGSP